MAHEGHQGIVRTKQLLQATTSFPGMDKKTETAVAHCMACQVTMKTPQQEPLKPTTLPTEPWDTLATDLQGPLSTGKYLLVVQCLYSRSPAVEIVRSTSADACIPVMDKILSQFGIPTVITSDNGPHYNSEKFKQYSKYMGFEHKKKIPYTPWANGTTENFMKNLGKVIEMAQEEKLNWRQELHRFLRAY
jgi:transposase InsO family protein